MTSVLDTQVTTQVCDDQVATEAKLTKKQKIQVIASQTPTIDFIDCDTEEEVLSPIPVVEEVINHLQTVTDFFNNNEMKYCIPNPRILESTSVSNYSTSTFLLSSIQTLSTFPVGEIPSPSLSQLHHTLISTSAPILAISVQHPMLSSTIAKTHSLKVPLPLP